MGCRLWGRIEVDTTESDLAAAARDGQKKRDLVGAARDKRKVTSVWSSKNLRRQFQEGGTS